LVAKGKEHIERIAGYAGQGVCSSTASFLDGITGYR